MKDLLIVSHCILNHAAKVEQDEAELAGEYKIREELLQLVLKKDVQLFQMPCPEFIMYGSPPDIPRPGNIPPDTS